MAARAGAMAIAKMKKMQLENKALCDVFDKADVTRDGTISIEEYITLCQEHGIVLTEEDIKTVEELADNEGEVHKADFILHIKQSNMLKEFEPVNRECDFHWKKKADLAFRIFDADADGFVSKKEFKWMTANKRVSQRKVDIMFQRCDLDGDGYLNYSEFTTLMFRQKERKERRAEEKMTKERRKEPQPKKKQKRKDEQGKEKRTPA